MGYGQEAATVANAPVNVALSNSLEQLQRCENLAQSIKDLIHGTQPEPPSTLAQVKGEQYLPHHASGASNVLAQRLQFLGDTLDFIHSSF